MKALLASALSRFWHSRAGAACASAFTTLSQFRVFAPATVRSMRFDLLRLRARRFRPRHDGPVPNKLHVGCGRRRVQGWLNVDIVESDCPVDLAAGALPWPDGVFEAIVSQHVIEHLELRGELLPLLRELRRVARAGAELWLSCPDMEKVCRAYFQDKGAGLIADRKTRRYTDLGLDGIPSQQMINELFRQGGEHKNLFDFELLDWALRQAGFRDCERVCERDLLERFPEFPARNDDYHSLYVRARA